MDTDDIDIDEYQRIYLQIGSNYTQIIEINNKFQSSQFAFGFPSFYEDHVL